MKVLSWFAWLLLSLVGFTGQAMAQMTAHYSVEFTNQKKEISVTTERWKVKRLADGSAFELDKGNENLELHDQWHNISTEDDETQTMERFQVHPTFALRNNMQSFTGYVKRMKLDGEVLEAWPSFHAFSILGDNIKLVSTYFPPDNSKIVLKRVYSGSNYFVYLLPYVLVKETFERAWDETPAEITHYKRVFIK